MSDKHLNVAKLSNFHILSHLALAQKLWLLRCAANDKPLSSGTCTVMQGVVGSIPWTALVFLTLYLQLIGMSDLHAGMLMSMSLGAYGVGNLIGGWVGDAAASRFPDHGRIAVAQFAEFIRIPISWLIIKVSHL